MILSSLLCGSQGSVLSWSFPGLRVGAMKAEEGTVGWTYELVCQRICTSSEHKITALAASGGVYCTRGRKACFLVSVDAVSRGFQIILIDILIC